MVWKVFFAILAIFLLLGAFASPINDGIKGWRTEDTTENEQVTTAGGVTTANVTLSNDLFQDDVTEVISISSNITESPIASSYVAASNQLLISALNAGVTRTLAINYYAETDNNVLQVVGPYLSLLIIGGLLVGIVMTFLKRR